MSGEGPESVPTSADPRSKRPTKKRALTPNSAQAASVNALFAKPDQDIRIPRQPGNGRALPAPPEIVTNVQGSSAGAGSGEFHVYKAARRREYERMRAMDEELRVEKAAENFDYAKKDRDARDEERTRKNREKRDKKKKTRAKVAASGSGGAAITTAATSGNKSGVARRELRAPGDGADEADEKRDPNGKTRDGQVTDVQSQPVGLVIHDED